MILIKDPSPERRWYVNNNGNMVQSSPVLIYQSRKKSFKWLVVSLIFVAAGIWMLTTPPKNDGRILEISAVHIGLAILNIVFFGLGAVLFLKRTIDKQPALIIDESGITDNASAANAGHVSWTDVTGLASSEIAKQQFINVMVTNPGAYIERQSGALKRKTMSMNWKRYGSPISIPTSSLNTNHSAILQQLHQYWKGE